MAGAAAGELEPERVDVACLGVRETADHRVRLIISTQQIQGRWIKRLKETVPVKSQISALNLGSGPEPS